MNMSAEGAGQCWTSPTQSAVVPDIAVSGLGNYYAHGTPTLRGGGSGGRHREGGVPRVEGGNVQGFFTCPLHFLGALVARLLPYSLPQYAIPLLLLQ